MKILSKAAFVIAITGMSFSAFAQSAPAPTPYPSQSDHYVPPPQPEQGATMEAGPVNPRPLQQSTGQAPSSPEDAPEVLNQTPAEVPNPF